MTIKSPQLLVVGLGNLPYPQTRHSVGHLIVDSLASHFGILMSMQRDIGGFYGSSDVTIGDTSVSLTLFKPKALMNITGSSVLSALRKSVRTPAHLVVIHDSLSHTPQTVSHKFAGSANGHNGVKSVISSLNKTEFHRLRVGIGRDNSVDPAVYVLGKLSGQELAFWTREGIDVILKQLEKLIPSVSPR